MKMSIEQPNTEQERERLNICLGSENPVGKILSNLADTPFSYNGYDFGSVEAVLQGIKFEDERQRQEVFALEGLAALKAGRKFVESMSEAIPEFVYWQEKEISYNSDEHRLLLASFIREKIRQNDDVMDALLSTENLFIYHDVGEESPNTSLPEKFYIEVLLSERKLLQKLRDIKMDKSNE